MEDDLLLGYFGVGGVLGDYVGVFGVEVGVYGGGVGDFVGDWDGVV